MRDVCQALEVQLLSTLTGVHAAREDSRAFGASVQARVESEWAAACRAAGALDPLDPTDPAWPGPRAIFDVGARTVADAQLVGVDVKTKDLDPGRYSDGGVCSVGNLLKFLHASHRFWIAEVGHSAEGTQRKVAHVRVVPLRALPIDVVRIENLGTGQVRVDPLTPEVMARLDWARTRDDFLTQFVALARSHFDRVIRDAARRQAALDAYRDSGFHELDFA